MGKPPKRLLLVSDVLGYNSHAHTDNPIQSEQASEPVGISRTTCESHHCINEGQRVPWLIPCSSVHEMERGKEREREEEEELSTCLLSQDTQQSLAIKIYICCVYEAELTLPDQHCLPPV